MDFKMHRLRFEPRLAQNIDRSMYLDQAIKLDRAPGSYETLNLNNMNYNA